ncbi:uncharacterized protein LOC143238628 isoform X2 [Tachypleus tridentatus]|uniref:uncharacterized protein LOC143238628 isoform X2 n=1 Tax=Tachypleus tridentatus TaxID=6853 RepID=UPI003FD35E52
MASVFSLGLFSVVIFVFLVFIGGSWRNNNNGMEIDIVPAAVTRINYVENNETLDSSINNHILRSKRKIELLFQNKNDRLSSYHESFQVMSSKFREKPLDLDDSQALLRKCCYNYMTTTDIRSNNVKGIEPIKSLHPKRWEVFSVRTLLLLNEKLNYSDSSEILLAKDTEIFDVFRMIKMDNIHKLGFNTLENLIPLREEKIVESYLEGLKCSSLNNLLSVIDIPFTILESRNTYKEYDLRGSVDENKDGSNMLKADNSPRIEYYFDSGYQGAKLKAIDEENDEQKEVTPSNSSWRNKVEDENLNTREFLAEKVRESERPQVVKEANITEKCTGCNKEEEGEQNKKNLNVVRGTKTANEYPKLREKEKERSILKNKLDVLERELRISEEQRQNEERTEVIKMEIISDMSSIEEKYKVLTLYAHGNQSKEKTREKMESPKNDDETLISLKEEIKGRRERKHLPVYLTPANKINSQKVIGKNWALSKNKSLEEDKSSSEQREALKEIENSTPNLDEMDRNEVIGKNAIRDEQANTLKKIANATSIFLESIDNSRKTESNRSEYGKGLNYVNGDLSLKGLSDYVKNKVVKEEVNDEESGQKRTLNRAREYLRTNATGKETDRVVLGTDVTEVFAKKENESAMATKAPNLILTAQEVGKIEVNKITEENGGKHLQDKVNLTRAKYVKTKDKMEDKKRIEKNFMFDTTVDLLFVSNMVKDRTEIKSEYEPGTADEETGPGRHNKLVSPTVNSIYDGSVMKTSSTEIKYETRNAVEQSDEQMDRKTGVLINILDLENRNKTKDNATLYKTVTESNSREYNEQKNNGIALTPISKNWSRKRDSQINFFEATSRDTVKESGLGRNLTTIANSLLAISDTQKMDTLNENEVEKKLLKERKERSQILESSLNTRMEYEPDEVAENGNKGFKEELKIDGGEIENVFNLSSPNGTIKPSEINGNKAENLQFLAANVTGETVSTTLEPLWKTTMQEHVYFNINEIKTNYSDEDEVVYVPLSINETSLNIEDSRKGGEKRPINFLNEKFLATKQEDLAKMTENEDEVVSIGDVRNMYEKEAVEQKTTVLLKAGIIQNQTEQSSNENAQSSTEEQTEHFKDMVTSLFSASMTQEQARQRENGKGEKISNEEEEAGRTNETLNTTVNLLFNANDTELQLGRNDVHEMKESKEGNRGDNTVVGFLVKFIWNTYAEHKQVVETEDDYEMNDTINEGNEKDWNYMSNRDLSSLFTTNELAGTTAHYIPESMSVEEQMVERPTFTSYGTRGQMETNEMYETRNPKGKQRIVSYETANSVLKEQESKRAPEKNEFFAREEENKIDLLMTRMDQDVNVSTENNEMRHIEDRDVFSKKTEVEVEKNDQKLGIKPKAGERGINWRENSEEVNGETSQKYQSVVDFKFDQELNTISSGKIKQGRELNDGHNRTKENFDNYKELTERVDHKTVDKTVNELNKKGRETSGETSKQKIPSLHTFFKSTKQRQMVKWDESEATANNSIALRIEETRCDKEKLTLAKLLSFCLIKSYIFIFGSEEERTFAYSGQIRAGKDVCEFTKYWCTEQVLSIVQQCVQNAFCSFFDCEKE